MTAPTPELPALAADESMLSRKFGREVANYFSGSPLNRLSFLRADHGFMSSAFTHPTASFLLLDGLSPLAKDPEHLAYVGKADVEPLTGPNPYSTSEEEQIKNFNSEVTHPLILFLGIDEKKATGFEFKEFKGTPYFAVDVTPKGALEGPAKSVIEAVKAKGIDFLPGQRHISLNAPEGECDTHPAVLAEDTRLTGQTQPQSMPKLEPCSTGTTAVRSARDAASALCL
jgi:NAD+ diphosphatase